MTPNVARGRLFVLSASILWSLSGVVSKSDALRSMNGESIAFYRSLFAGLALLPFVPRGRFAVRPVMVPLALVFGAMVGLYIPAILATTAANAIFLQCSAVFWMVPLTAVFLRERPDRRSLLGIALAMPGVLAIVGWGHGGTPGEWRGVAAGLASGVMYATVVVGLRGMRDLHPMWLSAWNNLGGALALGAWGFLVGRPVQVPTPEQAGVLAAFGVVQMAIPYALFALGLRAVSAPEAGLLSLIEPILNPLWVFLAHGERPRAATLVGGAFLLLGVAVRYLPVRRPVTAAEAPAPEEAPPGS